MKRTLPLAVLLVALAACARLPIIQPDAGSVTIRQDCRNLFPEGRWQLYHEIEATLPGGRKSILTGVTVLSSQNRSIECALMTVEGFVLFSARDNGALTIDRSIPPLDHEGFAQGLMNDLRLIFFSPRDLPCQTGRLDLQTRICRYCPDGQTIDIAIMESQTWKIRQYTSRNRLARSVEAGEMVHIAGQSFAKRLTLRNHGWPGYQLELKLLEAVQLE